MVDGIADNDLDALALEDLADGYDGFHGFLRLALRHCSAAAPRGQAAARPPHVRPPSRRSGVRVKIGRAHVRTAGTNAPLVCRLLHERTQRRATRNVDEVVVHVDEVT